LWNPSSYVPMFQRTCGFSYHLLWLDFLKTSIQSFFGYYPAKVYFFLPWCNSPQWAKDSSLSRIHDHTQTHSVGLLRTSDQPDLTTHNFHMRQTSMLLVGFEPTIPTSERPQTHALDLAATGIGVLLKLVNEMTSQWHKINAEFHNYLWVVIAGGRVRFSLWLLGNYDNYCRFMTCWRVALWAHTLQV